MLWQVLAGAIMSDADFTGANMQEAVLTKVNAWHRLELLLLT